MRAVLCGYYGMGNGGDEALLATLLQMLPPTVTPLVLSGNPKQTENRYGVEACDRKSLPAVLRAFRKSDAFIWGGGSLMQDTTSALNPLYYGGLMTLAQWSGLKTIAWGQGIGPLKRPFTRWLTRRTYKECTVVSVRDRASAELLHGWNIPFILAPDPVWALEGEAVPGLWDLPAPRVAVALRPHRTLTPQRLETLTQALIAFQKATQTCILLVPFQPASDGPIAQSIQARLPGPSQVIALEDPKQLRGLFQGVEMAIAMRLHGLIMAAAAECCCFGLSYDPKVHQLMTELDLPGCDLEQLADDPHSLSRLWIELYANSDPLSNDQIHSLRDRALFHEEVLHKGLLQS